jgi:hypothetical protein
MDSRARQEYINHGFGDRFTKYQPDADLMNDREFEEQCMPDSIKVRVDNVIRISRGAKGEWVKYAYTLLGKTRYGQERNRPKTESMWKKPIFEVVVDGNGTAREIDKVNHLEEIWTVRYTPDAVRKILALDEFNNNVGLTVQDGEEGRQYTVTNVDDFINKPLSELVPKERYY